MQSSSSASALDAAAAMLSAMDDDDDDVKTKEKGKSKEEGNSKEDAAGGGGAVAGTQMDAMKTPPTGSVPNYLVGSVKKVRMGSFLAGSSADGVFVRGSVSKEKGSDTKISMEPMSIMATRNTNKQAYQGYHEGVSTSTNVSRRSSLERLDLNGKKGPQKGTVEYVAPLLERKDEQELRHGEWGQTLKEKCVRVGEGCIIGLHVLPSLLRNKGIVSFALSIHRLHARLSMYPLNTKFP